MGVGTFHLCCIRAAAHLNEQGNTARVLEAEKETVISKDHPLQRRSSRARHRSALHVGRARGYGKRRADGRGRYMTKDLCAAVISSLRGAQGRSAPNGNEKETRRN